jgi:hypothetical protein
MKLNITLFAAALTALTFAAPACDSGGDEAKKEEAGDSKEEAKEDGKEEAKEEAKEEKKEEAPKEEAAAGGDDSTGIPECDEVIKRSKCSFEKIPDEAMRKQAEDGFKQMAAAWKGIPEEAKQATADGCKQALEAGKAGWEAQGC